MARAAIPGDFIDRAEMTKVFWIAVLLWVGMSASCPPELYAGTARVPELKLKAAFLYNFSKFVAWPEESLAEPEEPFIIGVLGKDPFGELLDSFSGKQVRGHPLVIRHFSRLKEVDRCHILFISESEKRLLGIIIETLADAPVLTVSDLPEFARRGGMIGFVKKGKNIRFAVNEGAAIRGSLKISSKFLKLAEVVYSE